MSQVDISPISELLANEKYTREVNDEISQEDISPTKLLAPKLICAISVPARVTPNQVCTSATVPQPVLFVQESPSVASYKSFKTRQSA